MPWYPEQFSAGFIAGLRETSPAPLEAVPYFDGLLAGETDALIRSFAGEPELHDPLRGRVRGQQAFRSYVEATAASLRDANASVEAVDLVVTPHRTIEEVVLSYDRDGRRIEVPIAIATDRSAEGLHELRIYYSTWPIDGGHLNRPPLLQPTGDAEPADAVGDYQRALGAGDLEGVLATFEPDATVREPAGAEYVHRGVEGRRELYTLFFSNGGGIELEHCTVTDDGRACALEYNVTRWGTTDLPPEAGIAVYVRGDSGLLAAARIYDDSNPPLHP